MQPSSPNTPYQVPQNNPLPAAQPGLAPVNFVAPTAAPYQQANYAYPQNMPVQYVQAAPQPAASNVQQQSGGHSEKVIQPIHDINAEQRQNELQIKMAELLGEPVEPAAKPTSTQGYTAETMQAQSAPTMSYTPLPHIQAPAQNYAQGQPSPYQQQAYYQQVDPQVAAAMQMQALRAEEMRRMQYAQATAAQQAASQQAQAQALYQQQMLNSARISPMAAQKVANSIVTPPIPMPPTPAANPQSGQENPAAPSVQQNNG
jgi:hypothetical protein